MAPAPVVAASAPINVPAMLVCPNAWIGISARQELLLLHFLLLHSSSNNNNNKRILLYVWQHDWCLGASSKTIGGPTSRTSHAGYSSHAGHAGYASDNSKSFSSPPPPQQQQQQQQQQADPFAMFGGMTGVSAPPSKQPVAQPVMPAILTMPTAVVLLLLKIQPGNPFA